MSRQKKNKRVVTSDQMTVDSTSRVPAWLICVLLAVVTAAIYLPALRFDFINCDDPEYFSVNPRVLAGLNLAGVKWAFTTGYFGNWLPLTWLSLMLDAQLFGGGAFGPHLTNVLLHTANAVLVFVLLRTLTASQLRSAFVAAAFALHPLRVESVAWVAERRDVLCAFFGLLTLICYAHYVRKTKIGKQKAEIWNPIHHSSFIILPYFLALVCFALGLMSKAMIVTIPFVMLLLDYWPLGRLTQHATRNSLKPLLLEKSPFFALSVASIMINFLTQKGVGAVMPLEQLPLSSRLANGFVSYGRYLSKMFWPENLAIQYPHPLHWPFVQVTLAALLVFALCAGATWQARRRPYVFVGWFWFFGMLFPVIGLIQTGPQAMADRFTYLPAVGLIILVAWLANDIRRQFRFPKAAVAVLAGLVMIALGARTVIQLSFWKNSGTLFSAAIDAVPDHYIAHNGLGVWLKEQGQVEDAIGHYRTALRIRPNHGQSLNNLGNALVDSGQLAEAAECFQTALASGPPTPEVLNNLGNLMARLGRLDEATTNLTRAIALEPEFADAHSNLGNVLTMKGDVSGALQQYQQAIAANPRHIGARVNYAQALIATGKLDDATSQLQQALKYDPQNAMARVKLAAVAVEQGRFSDAERLCRDAVQLQPQLSPAHFQLGRALAGLGRRSEAINELFLALKLDPGSMEIKDALRALGVNVQ